MAQELEADEIYKIAEEVVLWAIGEQREVKKKEAKAAIKKKIGAALYKKYSKEFKEALATVAQKASEKKTDTADDAEDDGDMGVEEEPEPAAEEEDDEDGDDDYEEKPKSKRKKSKPKTKTKTKRKRRLKKSTADEESDEEPKTKRKRRRKEEVSEEYPENLVGEPPKRPQSSFFLYKRDYRDQVKAENPDKKETEISKIIGVMWKEATAVEKKKYEEKAQEAKKEYELALEEFKRNNPDTWRAALSGKKKAAGTKRTPKAASAPELDEDGEPVPKSAFDEILDSFKVSRKVKEVQNVQETQERCTEFVNLMESCAEVDRKNYQKKIPATNKLAMLADVVAKCRKRLLQEYIMDSNVCRALAKWLEPLHDPKSRFGVLPNKTIREALYGLLAEMNIDADRLEASEYQYEIDTRGRKTKVSMSLGKVINLLFQHPDETVENKNKLRSLIEKWIRPLTDSSNNYEDMKEAEFNAIRENKQRRSALMNARVPAYIMNNPIPQAATFDYAIKPQSMVQSAAGPRSKPATDTRSRMLKKIKSKARK